MKATGKNTNCNNWFNKRFNLFHRYQWKTYQRTSVNEVEQRKVDVMTISNVFKISKWPKQSKISVEKQLSTETLAKR